MSSGTYALSNACSLPFDSKLALDYGCFCVWRYALFSNGCGHNSEPILKNFWRLREGDRVGNGAFGARFTFARGGPSELKQLKKKVNESFLSVKKTVTKFNTSTLYYIGMNVDPLNPRFHDFLTGTKNNLALLTDKKSKECEGKLDGKTVV